MNCLNLKHLRPAASIGVVLPASFTLCASPVEAKPSHVQTPPMSRSVPLQLHRLLAGVLGKPGALPAPYASMLLLPLTLHHVLCKCQNLTECLQPLKTEQPALQTGTRKRKNK